MTRTRTISLAAALFVLLAVFSGCKKTKTETLKDTDTLNVKVGTTGTYVPFSMVDENGKVTGYDIEVLRLIQKADPTLNFEFIASQWDTLFPGLDADKFQLLANQLVYTPERAARYYLTDNSYHLSVSQLLVKKGRTDIKSLKDLQGKKIGADVGDANTRVVEEWNDKNGKILNIIYYEGDVATEVLQDIVNGRVDANLNDPIMVLEKAKTQGLDIEVVGDRIVETPAIYLMRKDEKGALIKQKVDAALAKLRDDGSLSKLSIEWFGADYSK